MSDTPEVDRLEFEQESNYDVDWPDFARRLERERDEARKGVAIICAPLHQFVQNSVKFDGIDAGYCVSETIVRYAEEYKSECDKLRAINAVLLEALERVREWEDLKYITIGVIDAAIAKAKEAEA